METAVTKDMKQNVRRGAQWLDENHSGWALSINLDNLDMNNCNFCIVGQAIGNYYDVIDEIIGFDEDPDWPIERGFQAPEVWEDGMSYKDSQVAEAAYYKSLEVVWTEEVNSRLGT